MLDITLASRIWRILKDLPRSIHEAANHNVDLFELLPSHLDATHLHKIEMTTPHILQIENVSQNMLLSATTIEQVCRLFFMAQSIGLGMLKWIAEAQRCCDDHMDGLGMKQIMSTLTAFRFWTISYSFQALLSNLKI